ncbi:MAG TPA: helix-turn-helix domain-containing protein [Polyangiales bacterium]|nr:helix-turn-helix domain-containing protein [Polyangiales bacterium]
MKPYHQYCPVAQALELVGDRWALLVVRELLCGAHHFNDILRGVPRMPRSMLARRLEQLEATGLIEKNDHSKGSEYSLTEAGRALEEVLASLGLWARSHAHRQLREEEIDAGLLMWNVQRRIDGTRVPKGEMLVRFDFLHKRRGVERYWLKIKRGVGELCLKNPGMEESLVIHTDPRTFTEVWLGHREFGAAIEDGDIVIDGPTKLASSFPTWFLLNEFVELEAELRS